MLANLHAAVGDVPLIVGFVAFAGTRPYAGQFFQNAAAFLVRGQPAQIIHKSLLPTYDVFDEARYFSAAASTRPIEWNGRRLGVTICEDIWVEPYLPRPFYSAEPAKSLVEQGAEIILNLSASPFQCGKPRRRFEMIAALAAKYGVPFVYCNAVGGDDELIFDGNSAVFDARGGAIRIMPAFEEQVAVVDLDAAPGPAAAAARGTGGIVPRARAGATGLFCQVRLQERGARPERRHRLGRDGGAWQSRRSARRTSRAWPCPARFRARAAWSMRSQLAETTWASQCLQVPISEPFESFKKAIRDRVRRSARRHDGGKHAGPAARHGAHVALE